MLSRSWLVSIWLLLISQLARSGSEPKSNPPSSSQTLVCSLGTSTILSILGHPFEQAYNAAIVNNRAFMNPLNFRGFYRGFPLTLGQRFIASTYFIGQKHITPHFQPKLEEIGIKPLQAKALLAVPMGFWFAVVTCPPAVLKYMTWNDQHELTTIEKIKQLYQQGASVRHLYRAFPVHLAQCSAFSIPYEVSRYYLKNELVELAESLGSKPSKASIAYSTTIVANTLGSVLGSVCSTPFLFLRIKLMQNFHITSKEVIEELKKNIKGKPINKALKALRSRILLGTNIAKTTASVVIGQLVFDFLFESYPANS